MTNPISQQNRILIVDDQQAIRNLVARSLESWGYAFDVAANGREALACLAKAPYDLVLSDYLMPEMNGIELLWHVRQHCPDTEVIIFTSSDEPDIYQQTVEAGAADFIKKPFEEKELQAKINRVFREKNLIARLKIQIAEQKRAEEALQRQHQTQKALNQLLHLSLGGNSLQEIGVRFIEIVTQLPLLDLQPKGAIFLVEKDQHALKLIAQKGLAEPLLGKCAQVPYGYCLCGKTAETGQMVFAEDIDDRHDTMYPNIQPHGHYCVPIKNADGRLLGVFTLYTPAGCKREPATEDILLAAASVAASVIDKLRQDEETRELQVQLRQAQKLEAIGTLASGIAHDFNNILASIIGFSSLLKDSFASGSQEAEDIGQILKACNRSKDLVQQILAFSRQAELSMISVQLQTILKEVVKLLRGSLPTTIEINANVDRECPMVQADPTQIHQIVMNLATNAYHAMKESGGELDISLRHVIIRQGDDMSGRPGLEPGEYARLQVRDTGHGMDKTTIERIFEPYFTTKEKGVGTGLGLAVVHGIVQNHHGHIFVRSVLDEGTVFEVFFPCIHASQNTAERIEDHDLPKGTEAIMAVDDDEQILKVIKRTLERQGYSVEIFSEPEKALLAFEENPEKFDLLITDMTMPKMTGAKLSEAILAIRADIPIIMCTGFSDIIDPQKAADIGIKKFIMKPVIRTDFVNSVRSVLDGKA